MPAGVMLYTSIQRLEGLTKPADYGAGIQDGNYLLEKYPQAVVQLGLYLVDALEDVAAGKYDEHIARLGEWIKKADRPVYLRIGYEFDYSQNHYEPKKYMAAFRYIVDYLRRENVNNVSFVWHSYAGYVQGYRTDWYPGDNYVDWFAISFFDAYNRANMEGMARLAEEHQKPFMIAEAMPKGLRVSDGEKVWKRWFKKFFEFIHAHNVKIVCYINWDWDDQPMFKGQNWGDARIESNQLIKERWLEEINGIKYFQTSEGLGQSFETVPSLFLKSLA